jgi:hypothetical protein
MTVDQLGMSVASAYSRAPAPSKATYVVLRGIKNVEKVRSSSIIDVVAVSGIVKWGAQVALGVKLSEYVVPKS